MADSFTTVEEESWGSRLVTSIKSVFVGVVLVLIAFPVLFWNEGRAVRTARGLAQGKAAVVSVAADAVDAANAGRLIFLSGHASTAETLADPVFGVSANALRLLRDVEIFEWVEDQQTRSEKKLGGGEQKTTTYSYTKQWRKNLVASDHFHEQDGHANPAAMGVASAAWQAREVKVGAFAIPASLVSALPAADEVATPPAVPAAAASSVTGKVAASGGGFYVGDDPANPQVGDLRVAFHAAQPMDVSVLGRQTESSIGAFATDAGTTLLRIEPSLTTADAMFRDAARENTMLTWLVRGAGFFSMLVGFALIGRPLVAVADVVPFVGSLLGAGVGVLAFAVALPLTLTTIAIAWFAYRPLLAGGLLVASVGVFVIVKQLSPARAH